MSEDFVLRETAAEASVDWRIQRFLSLPEESDYYLHSPAFSLSDAQWHLGIYPNGDTQDDSVGWISLYLFKRFSSSKKHAVKYTLGIRRKNDSVFKSIDAEHAFEMREGRGWPRFVLGSELKQSNVLSSDRTLTVFATLRLTEPTVLDESNIVDIPRELTFRATHFEEVSWEWKVEGFTSLPKEPGYNLKSPTSSLGGATLCLQLHPNGLDANYQGWVSLFLRRERYSSEKQTVAYALGIRKTDGTAYRLFHGEAEFGTNITWGCRKFLCSSELLDSKNGLVYQGSVTLFCTARANVSPLATAPVAEQGTQTSSHSRQKESASQTTSSERNNPSQLTCVTLHENLRNIFVNEHLCDVTIKVQDQNMPAHRTILAARSSVFAAMFEHDTEERRTGIININDFDAASFRAFLSFVYSADVEVVSADNATPLYKAADKYDLQDLKNECLRYLENGLSLGSFFEVVELAFLHSEPTLLKTAGKFFVDNAKEIIVTPEWQAMNIKHPALTSELLIKMATERL